MKSVRYVGIVLTRGIDFLCVNRLSWNFAKTYLRGISCVPVSISVHVRFNC